MEEKELIEKATGLRNLIKVTETDATNHKFFKKSIAQRRESIAKIERQIAQLEYRRDNADQIIRQSRKELRKTILALKVEKNKHAIEQYRKLYKKVNASE